MATITDLQNNITGLSFRQTLNDNFDNLNNDKAELTTVQAIDTRLTTAETNITTNTTNISGLDTRLSQAETELAVLSPLNSFNYSQIGSTLVSGDVYENIVNDTYLGLAAGTYKLELSMLYTLNSTTTSAFFRFSIDGGINWVEVRREAKDVNDINPAVYDQVLVLPDGDFTIIIQARKEQASDVLTIHELSASLERKV